MMSLRNLFAFSKSIGSRTTTLCTTNFIRSKVSILSAYTVRFYSNKNAGNHIAEKVSGRFIAQLTVNSDKAREVRKEGEHMKREKNLNNGNSWRLFVFSAAVTVMGACFVVQTGAPTRGDDGEVLEDGFNKLPLVMQYLKRTWNKLTLYSKKIKEPSRVKLLPDPLPGPYQPAYTLVIEVTDVLVHPEWSYRTGWRFKKRPGVDTFVQTVANSDYEVVIFTAESPLSIYPVLDKLDPGNQLIAYRLFKDSTHFKDGVHIKDLGGLNRDLAKVIVVDCNKQASMFHAENSIILNKWEGADDDSALPELANFLQVIAMFHVSDVREVLSYYNQFEDPIAAFRENQQRLIERMEEQKREPKENQTFTSQWIPRLARR